MRLSGTSETSATNTKSDNAIHHDTKAIGIAVAYRIDDNFPFQSMVLVTGATGEAPCDLAIQKFDELRNNFPGRLLHEPMSGSGHHNAFDV